MAKDQPKRKSGRPSAYTPEIAEAICVRLSAGETLRAICRDHGVPPESTVRGWALDDVQGFSARYAKARSIGLDIWAEELITLADTPQIGEEIEESDDGKRTVRRRDMLGHRRLQVDTRKWLLCKLAPHKYGDLTRTELTGAGGGPLQISDTERGLRAASLIALAEARRTKQQTDLDPPAEDDAPD